MSKLPFGKHKGEEVCDVPTHYLKWLEENTNLDILLRREINHEIERREGDRSSIGLTKIKITPPKM